ncbi:glycosyltransferase [Paucibacter sp. JuS9]|uniref:glycosyltransferase n=1 Tax=Paucibacter sp. JuS9 TaxID=3228748 RepID=UPI003756317F
MSDAAGRLLLYAPNVHTGGGFVLLQALLAAWPAGRPLVAWLDARARGRLVPPAGSEITWVRASFGSRLGAEVSLARAGRAQDRVLCFHGLPPLMRNAAPVLVFQQNRNYLGLVPLAAFSWKTRQRLRFEQAISRLFRRRVASYWVQTPSMARALRAWYGAEPVKIHVMPFALPAEAAEQVPAPRWDFVYVADGEAHKNHRTLIEAWALLAEQGLRPTLALTLSSRDAGLASWIAGRAVELGLQVSNLGTLAHADVLQLYGSSRALMFPSKSESFGLPLIEARNAGLPILAGELDFVRDVCEPVQTFDPGSAVSMARAVRRFLQLAEAPLQPVGAADFLRALHDDAA